MRVPGAPQPLEKQSKKQTGPNKNENDFKSPKSSGVLSNKVDDSSSTQDESSNVNNESNKGNESSKAFKSSIDEEEMRERLARFSGKAVDDDSSDDSSESRDDVQNVPLQKQQSLLQNNRKWHQTGAGGDCAFNQHRKNTTSHGNNICCVLVRLGAPNDTMFWICVVDTFS